MRKFISAVVYHKPPFSKKLLISSFIAGYVVAVIIFGLFNRQVHHFMEGLFYGF